MNWNHCKCFFLITFLKYTHAKIYKFKLIWNAERVKASRNQRFMRKAHKTRIRVISSWLPNFSITYDWLLVYNSSLYDNILIVLQIRSTKTLICWVREMVLIIFANFSRFRANCVCLQIIGISCKAHFYLCG